MQTSLSMLGISSLQTLFLNKIGPWLYNYIEYVIRLSMERLYSWFIRPLSFQLTFLLKSFGRDWRSYDGCQGLHAIDRG